MSVAPGAWSVAVSSQRPVAEHDVSTAASALASTKAKRSHQSVSQARSSVAPASMARVVAM